MSFDVSFNPCWPLVVGFLTSFAFSINTASVNRKINENGVLFTYPHINRFALPALFASIVAAIIQASGDNSGTYTGNRLADRTAIQQGGWEIVGFLISAACATIAGLIVGLCYKLINNFSKDDQFNDEVTY